LRINGLAEIVDAPDDHMEKRIFARRRGMAATMLGRKSLRAGNRRGGGIWPPSTLVMGSGNGQPAMSARNTAISVQPAINHPLGVADANPAKRET
jgi:hypothetical protein